MQLKELNRTNFDSFSKLLSGSEFGGCFCAVWRSFDETWSKRCQDSSKPNLSLSKSFVENGFHLGYLVLENEELIGWTGSGPKTEFPLLETKLASRLTPFTSNIWSLGCIAVKQSSRGKSKSEEIILATIKKAKEHDALWIEAYPIDPWDEPRSYRGSIKQFERLGLERYGAEIDGDSKVVCMRMKLI